MTINLHIHFHEAPDDSSAVLSAINELKGIIMANDEQAAAALNQVAATLDKVKGETTALLEEIAALKVIVEQGNEISPELQAAIDAVTSRATSIDELVPDAAPAPAAEPDPGAPAA